MDIIEVRNMLGDIRNSKDFDPEAAQGIKNDLYEKVLNSIAKGDYLTVGDCEEVAKEALKAKRIKLKW